jgi:hypothetical protein
VVNVVNSLILKTDTWSIPDISLTLAGTSGIEIPSSVLWVRPLGQGIQPQMIDKQNFIFTTKDRQAKLF